MAITCSLWSLCQLCGKNVDYRYWEIAQDICDSLDLGDSQLKIRDTEGLLLKQTPQLDPQPPLSLTSMLEVRSEETR